MISISSRTAQDGTVKVLWKLEDAQTIESVILPRALKQRKNLELWQAGSEKLETLDRFTACISSQVGCAMACDFCQTGKQGLTRNLTAQEIIQQVTELNKIKPITNIVFMGMGEPLHNLANVIEAIQFFLKELKLSRRKIIVSTSGLIQGLPELAKTGVKLAVSLNATTDELRTKLMPVNKRFPISELISAAKEYGINTNQAVMLEYILMKELSDSMEDAARLVQIAQGWDCKVNLIPYNSFDGVLYQRPSAERVKEFQHALVSNGITATVRYSGGDDIYAACGQLKSEGSFLPRNKQAKSNKP